MARLATSVFVSALIRRISDKGGAAVVGRKGNGEAGEVFIAIWQSTERAYVFFEPVSAYATESAGEMVGGRAFRRVPEVMDPIQLSARVEREAKFDTDFWLVEIEHCDQPITRFVTVID